MPFFTASVGAWVVSAASVTSVACVASVASVAACVVSTGSVGVTGGLIILPCSSNSYVPAGISAVIWFVQ